jgi:phospholipase C
MRAHDLRRPACLIALFTLVAVGCSGRANDDQSPSGERDATSGTSNRTTSAGTGAVGGPHGMNKLEHLIFIVQENRSFDHYFGTFPGADGIPMRNGKPAVCLPDPILGRCARPYHTTSLYQDGGRHDHPAAVADVNDGRMDGFVRVASMKRKACAGSRSSGADCDDKLGPDGQPDVMSYHTAKEIPNYWTYAKEFVLQDAMFAPTDSWTLPAHLFLVSGWAADCSDPNDPMSCESDLFLDEPGDQHRYGRPPVYAWTDITWLLHRAGVSWAYYTGPGTCIDPPCHVEPGPEGKTPSGKNPLPGFTDVHETDQLDNIKWHDAYFEAASEGTLPSVSWIVPGSNVSDHPTNGQPVSRAQSYVTRLVNAAMRGPDWDSTAVFLTWDDWGGFYDHVEPPRVDENGYGLRVPGLLMSPYAKEGYIDHQTLTFDAYLKFIEDRFLDGQRLDPKTDGRPDSRPTVREDLPILGDLRREFDFNQPPRPPLILDPRP